MRASDQLVLRPRLKVVEEAERGRSSGWPFSITQTDLFASLDERESAAVSAIGRVRVLSGGSTLSDLRDPTESVFIVREGRLDVTARIPSSGGADEVDFETLGPGDTYGWTALAPPHHPEMVARAATPVILLGFRRNQLLELMRTERRIGATLAANLAKMLGRRRVRMQGMWSRPVRVQLDRTG